MISKVLLLFDGHTRDVNLNGIEYIISEKLFNQLPTAEKQYWHPHNYEILSGQLVAPSLPDVAELALIKGKVNSYGKTWHMWKTAIPNMKGDPLPYRRPRAGLVEARDRAIGVDSAETRRKRADPVPFARPQSGVDVLHGKFPRPTRPIPGLTDLGGETPSPNATLPVNGQPPRPPRSPGADPHLEVGNPSCLVETSRTPAKLGARHSFPENPCPEPQSTRSQALP